MTELEAELQQIKEKVIQRGDASVNLLLKNILVDRNVTGKVICWRWRTSDCAQR